MNPLIEQAANWALDFANDLKPETQRDFIESLAEKAAGAVHSTENEIDDKAALIFIEKLNWFLSETETRIRTSGSAQPNFEEDLPHAHRVVSK